MKLHYRRIAAAAVCGLTMWLSGCSALGNDIVSLLKPPQAYGEQGQVEQALKEYIASTLTQETYVLKYPGSGTNRGALLLEELDGDGNREALAFYRLGAEGNPTHINFLRNVDGKWRSVYDLESGFSEVNRFCLGDFDGDGVKELVVSWDMYSNRLYQVALYGINGNRLTEQFSGSASAVTVADVTGDGRDDCLFWNIGSESLTVTLWQYNNGVMEAMDTCTADGAVVSLSEPAVFLLENERLAVCADAVQTGGATVSELVYWDKERLVAPFATQDEDGALYNRITQRTPAIPGGDVDNDGKWEFPVCTLLAGYTAGSESLPTTAWKTAFYHWEDKTGVSLAFSCIYSLSDRYYLLLDNNFQELLTTRYDAETRTLWVDTLPTAESPVREPLFAVRAVQGSDSVETDESYAFQKLAEGTTTTYLAWCRPDNTYAVNMETLQYRFVML